MGLPLVGGNHGTLVTPQKMSLTKYPVDLVLALPVDPALGRGRQDVRGTHEPSGQLGDPLDDLRLDADDIDEAVPSANDLALGHHRGHPVRADQPREVREDR